jgi:hypothetical protein
MVSRHRPLVDVFLFLRSQFLQRRFVLAMQQSIRRSDLILRKRGPLLALEVNDLRVKEIVAYRSLFGLRLESRVSAKFAGAALIKEFNLVTPFWGTSKTELLKIKTR